MSRPPKAPRSGRSAAECLDIDGAGGDDQRLCLSGRIIYNYNLTYWCICKIICLGQRILEKGREGIEICEANECKDKMVNENHSHFHNDETIITP